MSRQPYPFELELAAHAKSFLEATDQATKLRLIADHPALLTQIFFDRPGQYGGEFKSLLHEAVKAGNKSGDLSDVKLLLDNKADPNIKVCSYSPIHFAKNLNLVKLLHEYGADLHDTSVTRKNVFHSYGLSNDAIDYFIEHGVDVKLVNTDCTLPLHFAASSGNDYLVSALIKAGAPVNAGDSTGATALHYAVQNNMPNTAHLLVKAGADILARDGWRETPLQCCEKFECEVDPFASVQKMPRKEKPEVEEAILKALHELAADASSASADTDHTASAAGHDEGGAASSSAVSAIPAEDHAPVAVTGEHTSLEEAAQV